MRWLLCLAVVMCTSALAAPVKIPGTRVVMTAPPSFTLAPDFPGFVDPRTQATIAIAELPASFVETAAANEDTELTRSGAQVLSRESLEQDGLRAILIETRQRAGTRWVRKLLLLTGDMGESLTITATYLQKDHKQLGAELRTSLLGAVWDASNPLDYFEGLQFHLDEIPGLRVATRANNTIVITEDGRLPDRYYTGAMMVIGWSDGDVTTVDDVNRFASEQFLKIRLLEDRTIENTTVTTVDGRIAVEVTGSGNHRHLGYRLNVYQLIVPYEDRFLMAQGFSGSATAENIFSKFRNIMNSLSAE